MAGQRSLFVIAVIASLYLLHWGAPFFIPLFVAILISYALSPVVDQLTRLVRVRGIAAAIVVLALVAGLGFAAWSSGDDIQAVWQRMPDAVKTISRNLQKFAKPSRQVAEMKKAAEDIESVAKTGQPAAPTRAAPPAPADSGSVSQISIWQVLYTGGAGIMVVAVQVTVVTFLVFFMLASGSMFKKKLVLISGERLAQRKFTVQVIDEIDAQVRRYLLVMLVANTLVGLGTWAIFAFTGLLYPGLWGLAAAIVHTIPYFGPALIAAGSFVVALVQFGDLSRAFVVAGASVVWASLVGTLFATWFASRQMSMNATASFVGLLFFGWIWGLWGLLLGIPLLAIVKTVCDHKEEWKPVGELLGP